MRGRRGPPALTRPADERLVALRLGPVELPAGAVVESAALVHTVPTVAGGKNGQALAMLVRPPPRSPALLPPAAHPAPQIFSEWGDAAPVSVERFSLSSRPTTSSPVPWVIEDEAQGVEQSSPDIGGVVREAVESPDWQSGGSILLMFLYARGEGTRWLDAASATLRISYVLPCEEDEYDYSVLIPVDAEDFNPGGGGDDDDGAPTAVIAAVAVAAVLLSTLIVAVIRPWSTGEVSLWSDKRPLAMSEVPFRFTDSPELAYDDRYGVQLGGYVTSQPPLTNAAERRRKDALQHAVQYSVPHTGRGATPLYDLLGGAASPTSAGYMPTEGQSGPPSVHYSTADAVGIKYRPSRRPRPPHSPVPYATAKMSSPVAADDEEGVVFGDLGQTYATGPGLAFGHSEAEETEQVYAIARHEL